jgi:hypothetical protein
MADAQSPEESAGTEMKPGYWILGAILLLLAVAAFLVLQRPGETSSEGSSGKVLVEYDSAAVDRIEIHSSHGAVTLGKEAGKWMLTAPLRYRADENSVTAAVGKGKSLDLGSLISTNPEKQELFQVDSAGTLVKVFERGTERAAFRVGKQSASWTETYVRLEGSNDVYATAGILSSIFARQAKDWRDKTIFKMERDEIKSVTFHYGDTVFTLSFTDSMWRVDGDSAVQTSVSTFLGAVSNFQTDEFVDSSVTKLPPLVATIDVEGTQIRFYHAKDAIKYYVQSSSSPQWFDVMQWRVSQILKRKKDFLPTATS